MAMRVLTFLALLALSACGGSNQTAGESPSPTAPAQVTPSATASATITARTLTGSLFNGETGHPHDLLQAGDPGSGFDQAVLAQ